jgi:hypothetical protein
MSEPATNPNQGAEHGHLPIATMIGAGLSFFLFAGLVGIMFWLNRQFYKPQDENVERQKQLRELKETDLATLTTYGKTDTPDRFRIPIDRAIETFIRERNEQNKEKAK